jgi:hypothetical protein
MKLAALLFAGVGMLGAASWDGTKGTVTIKTESDATQTVISVSTTDPDITLIQVTVEQKCDPTIKPGCVQQVNHVFLQRVQYLSPRPVLAIFNIPESQISRVFVTTKIDREQQAFGE